MTWIIISDRLELGLSGLNRLNKENFETLISDVFKKKMSPKSHPLYTNEEKQKLQESLELLPNDIENMIYAIVEIISAASYENIDPTTMKKTMEQLFNLDKQKVDTFCLYWSLERKSIIHILEDKTILPKVTGMNWSLDIGTCSSIKSKEAQTNVKLQLDLEDVDESKLTVQLEREGLKQLFDELEKIQAGLDRLNKE